MARGTKRNQSNEDGDQDLPLWALKMMEKYDSCADRMEKALLAAFDKIVNKIEEISARQEGMLSRIAALERNLSSLSKKDTNQNALYSTMVRVRADEKMIDDKLKRIAWVGVGEQKDDLATKKFDKEALKEVIETSGDDELIAEFSKGNITAMRHPSGQPRGVGNRGRIIKISLPSQELKDRLLRHMRSGRQSLTKNFVHSYARRDYTAEELELDRSLRKQAGQWNASEGKLQYVVRDLQICRLKNPRELPHNPRSDSQVLGDRSTLSSSQGMNMSLASNPSSSSVCF